MGYEFVILLLFIIALIFLVKSVKNRGKFIRIFSYVFLTLLVVSVIYVELLAKPMPYIGKTGEAKIAQSNEALVEAIKVGKVTEQQKESLLQSFTQKVGKKLYLNASDYTEMEFIVKKSATAKEATINSYHLAMYFEGYKYQYTNYPKFKIENEESLMPNSDDVLPEKIYVISSGVFFVPGSFYYEGEKKVKEHAWRNNGTQIVEVIVPQDTKVFTENVVLIED
ncbi:MAG: hypothetical protein KBT36_15755 [Kurthia sp.]|nr:hypothetical protein [Candidatus Kurthia equi]